MSHTTMKFLSVLVGMISAVQLCAMTPARKQQVSDSLKAILPRMTTPSDSLAILYDIMDVATLETRSKAAADAYAVAKRTNDFQARADLLRRIANYSLHNDSIQTHVLMEAGTLPEGDVRDETELFIKAMRITTRARLTSGEERQRNLLNLISDYKDMLNKPSDQSNRLYDRLEKLYALCVYMGLTSHGQMLTQYIDSLGLQIEKLPPHMQSLRNLYYTNAAISYTANGISDKAIAADKALLNVIDNLERNNHENGREFSNYIFNRYNCYRRILSNYKKLSDAEIDDYYGRILDLTLQSPTVANDFKTSRRPEIYYLMAKKRYAEVLPIIKSVIDHKGHEPFRRRFYQFIIEAAKNVGDNASLLEASLAYNNILENYLNLRSDETLRELQILYNVNSLMDENNSLRLNTRDNEISRQKRFSMILLALGVVLAVIVVIAVMFYLRIRKLAANLEKSNETLRTERDNLRHTHDELVKARDRARNADRHKTDFINNMSHEVSAPLNTIVEYSRLIVENVDEKRRSYLDRFARSIEISADLLRTLVNDVLEVSSLDNGQPAIIKRPADVKLLCETAISTRSQFIPDNLKVIFDNAGDNETLIITDGRRVEQVLNNMLSNATKFTESGTVHIGYEIDQIRHTITFYVSDTGIGIPEDKREVIFERFIKLNRFTQGNGLGLAISRMIARLLGGDIWVDPDHNGPGCRFLFRIPIE